VVNALLTLATVKVWTTAEVAFPIQIALLTGLQVLLVTGRLGPRLRREERASPTPSEKVIDKSQPGSTAFADKVITGGTRRMRLSPSPRWRGRSH